jgi:hypothetical protein
VEEGELNDFMTRAEFIEKNESQRKNSARVNAWYLGYLVVFALCLIWLNKHENPLPEVVRGPILMIGLFGGLFGIIIFFGKRAQKQRRELGLYCPQCKKDLLGLSFQIVVASGRCGRCGAVILEDWNK